MIAIDPGANGGIAVLHRNMSKPCYAFKMPETEGDIVQELKALLDSHRLNDEPLVAVIEEVGGFVGGGGQPGSRMFKFGRGFGFILGALQMSGWSIIMVRPQKWQKALCLGVRGDMTKHQWKNKLKAVAQQLYPNIQVTLDTADALLIMQYAIMPR